jgi:23S rRNA pseudouridine1911/1915/1917 synthase
VEPARAGDRLDVYLAGRGLPYSRSQIRRRIDEGEVQVDGAAGKPAQKLRAGQWVRFSPPPPRQVADLPEDIPLRILYEDRHLIVVDKPAGMVVHPAPGHETGTLVNALLFHCRHQGPLPLPPRFAGPYEEDDEDDDETDSRDEEDDDGPPGTAATAGGLSIGGERRPGIVHRLDQGTSGVLVCAKDEPTLIGLQVQFQAHTIKRRYLALVEGVTAQAGTFRTRYGRHPTDRKRFTGRGGKRHAVTHFTVVERLAGATLVEARLETGRTHQIRVHFSETGHPLLGDPLYGKRPRQPLLREVEKTLGHQALHARVLGFVHPVTGADLELSAPPPDDFLAAVSHLRAGPLAGGGRDTAGKPG